MTAVPPQGSVFTWAPAGLAKSNKQWPAPAQRPSISLGSGPLGVTVGSRELGSSLSASPELFCDHLSAKPVLHSRIASSMFSWITTSFEDQLPWVLERWLSLSIITPKIFRLYLVATVLFCSPLNRPCPYHKLLGIVKGLADAGSKSKVSESSLGGHGELTEDHAAISRARNSSITIDMPRDDTELGDMPPNMTPSESSPHDDTKLGFTVSAVELLGALSNLAASPKAKEHQLLTYTVVISSAFAFLLSSTAFLLGKKKMVDEEKLQKAAFLFGAFGFLGIIGLLLPASIMWWFTISAFLVFLFIFAIANMRVEV